ncbi:uncharacterized protein LOC122509455 [Leptopilina heterotoma]|uniref:uncharacterized protein LOC122509455 n=1 Tax=Leptopilina heterotoma TaxID=63436 RepID=UPI001CA82A09|nr:uncharacterized protein LOC122509455 [Leptopilina heterotoma]
MSIFFHYFIFIINCAFIFCDKCCEIGLRESPGYVLVKSNAKSLKSVIARKEVLNVEKCKEFAESKKALAFNFGSEESKNNFRSNYNGNCVALDCPEVHNFTALQNATGVKYYSSYPYWIWANDNSTNGSLSCVPKVGLFLFFEEPFNFAAARLTCGNLNSTLAHVISEERTEGLTKIIGNVPTFVGLSSQDRKRTWKNEFDEPLECFDYRAWGEREPSHSRGCVALTRPNLKDSPFWKVLPCNVECPFICEIPPAKYI